MKALIHGLEVEGAQTNACDPPTVLVYTPAWEHRDERGSFAFEGDRVGGVEFDLATLTWCPVDADGPWPLDRQGESINTTFGRREEHEAERVRFDNLPDAVLFLAALWNQHNPSRAIRPEPAQGVAA